MCGRSATRTSIELAFRTFEAHVALKNQTFRALLLLKKRIPCETSSKNGTSKVTKFCPCHASCILAFFSCLFFTCLICSFLFVSLWRLLFWWSRSFISLIFPSFLYFSDMFWFFLSFSSCWFSDDLFYRCFLFCFFSWSLRSSRFSFVY